MQIGPTLQVQQSHPGTVYISFQAEVNPMTAEALLATCANIANARVPQICLLLSTPGGAVMSGIAIYNTLRALPVHLITHNMGSVNSIGNVVFLAGEERYASPNSSFMFHGVGFDLQGQMRFEERQLRERLDALESDQRKIGAIIAERTSLTEDAIKELFLAAVTKDPTYAKANGIVHEVRELRIPAGAPVEQLVFQR